MILTYNESQNTLDKKGNADEIESLWFPPGFNEVREIINILKSVLLELFKIDVSATTDITM